MAQFKVYKFNNKKAYENVMNLKNELRFGDLKDSDEEYFQEQKEELDEMLKYAPQVWKFNSWEKVKEYLDEHDYTIWEEIGNLEERTICEKCGATTKTNSEKKLKEARKTHQIQTCHTARK